MIQLPCSSVAKICSSLQALGDKFYPSKSYLSHAACCFVAVMLLGIPCNRLSAASDFVYMDPECGCESGGGIKVEVHWDENYCLPVSQNTHYLPADGVNPFIAIELWCGEDRIPYENTVEEAVLTIDETCTPGVFYNSLYIKIKCEPVGSGWSYWTHTFDLAANANVCCYGNGWDPLACSCEIDSEDDEFIEYPLPVPEPPEEPTDPQPDPPIGFDWTDLFPIDDPNVPPLPPTPHPTPGYCTSCPSATSFNLRFPQKICLPFAGIDAIMPLSHFLDPQSCFNHPLNTVRVIAAPEECEETTIQVLVAYRLYCSPTVGFRYGYHYLYLDTVICCDPLTEFWDDVICECRTWECCPVNVPGTRYITGMTCGHFIHQYGCNNTPPDDHWWGQLDCEGTYPEGDPVRMEHYCTYEWAITCNTTGTCPESCLLSDICYVRSFKVPCLPDSEHQATECLCNQNVDLLDVEVDPILLRFYGAFDVELDYLPLCYVLEI